METVEIRYGKKKCSKAEIKRKTKGKRKNQTEIGLNLETNEKIRNFISINTKNS